MTGLASRILGHLALDPAGLRFLWGYLRPYRRAAFASVVIAGMIGLLGGLLAWVVQRIVAGYSADASLRSVVVWIGIALAGGLAQSGLGILNKYLLALIHARQCEDMRRDLYRELQSKPLSLHTQVPTGELSNLLTQDVAFAAAGMTFVYSAFWQQPITIVCLVGLMLYLNPLLSLLAVGLLPVVVLGVARVGLWSRRSAYRCMEIRGNISALLVESLINVRQVQSFGMQESRLEGLTEKGDALVREKLRATLHRSLATPVTEVLVALMIGLMAIVAWFQLRADATSVGALSGCLVAAFWLIRPLKRLSEVLVQMQRSFAATQRISWVLEERAPGRRAGVVEGPVEEIALDSVSFTYDGKRMVLDGVDLKASRGERLAVFGPSGSGKTTITELITGFYPATRGRVLIDGRDLRQLDLESWRQRLGVVSQEPFLFDGTIEDNVRTGCPDATPERILEALSLAGADEMLGRLDAGIATRVGERGRLLSGGERKRVALARALVRPISVLVLDEATSELDGPTEKGILERLDALAPSLITIHVSHRRSVLDHCDRVLLLESGAARAVSPDEARSER